MATATSKASTTPSAPAVTNMVLTVGPVNPFAAMMAVAKDKRPARPTVAHGTPFYGSRDNYAGTDEEWSEHTATVRAHDEQKVSADLFALLERVQAGTLVLTIVAAKGFDTYDKAAGIYPACGGPKSYAAFIEYAPTADIEVIWM